MKSWLGRSPLKSRPEKAAHVLIRASLTYGIFLEKSEPVIKHGLTAEVTKLLAHYFSAEAGSKAETPSRQRCTTAAQAAPN
jgi:hypothetical protein